MIVEPLTQSEENIKQAIEEVMRDGQAYNYKELREVVRKKVNVFGFQEVMSYLLRERAIVEIRHALGIEPPEYRLTSTI